MLIRAAEAVEMMIARNKDPQYQRFAKATVDVENAAPGKERWNALREMYGAADIQDYTPYPVDWIKIMTPIEFQVWQDIRRFGLPLWPQYPACGVFFDFADPLKHIAIECDGKDWHDSEKDAARDEKVADQGWIVFRLTGAECYRSDNDLNDLMADPDYDESERQRLWAKYAFASATGLFKAISIVCYRQQTSPIMSVDQATEVLSRKCTTGWFGG